MKQFFTYLILLITLVANSQAISKKYDYFIQFNGDQLSKKVSVADVLNHSLIKQYKEKNADFDFQLYADLFKLDQKTTVNGNFTGETPYYQITIPARNRSKIKDFMQKLNAKKEADSLPQATIQEFPLYTLLTTGDKKTSIAWNDNYFVIIEFTKKYPSNLYENDSIQEEVTLEVAPEETVEEPAEETEEEMEERIRIDSLIADEDFKKYERERVAFDSLQLIEQTNFVKTLFENGFTAPTSDKITANADISSWVDYGTAMSSFYKSFGVLYPFTTYKEFLPTQKNYGDFVKGMNIDFYFDNNGARLEQIVEYSDPIATIAGKITNRRINNRIFKYFPNQKPLGYLSYHINSKAALENIPLLTSKILDNPKFQKEDIAIVTDLISTIVDEEATARLFDGDLSMFLYGTKEIEITKKTYEYDENYEETEVLKKIEKTVPLFSIIFTSTHPTFGDKLIQLGVRKNLLVQKGNYYEITGTKEYGDMFILKDKDVIVIGNSLDYLQSGDGGFAKDTQKELKTNYFLAKLNIAETANAYKNSEKPKIADVKRLDQLAKQFSDISILSSKKLKNNKLKFELKLNSLQSNKNIILQTLDFVEELGK